MFSFVDVLLLFSVLLMARFISIMVFYLNTSQLPFLTVMIAVIDSAFSILLVSISQPHFVDSFITLAIS